MRIRFDNLEIKSTKRLLTFIPKEHNPSGFHFTLGSYRENTLLDLHATLPVDADRKEYTSLEKIPTSEISSATDLVLQNFSDLGIELRKVRLGWLRRNDYWVITSKFLPKKWFEIQKNYDFSTAGIRKYKDKISRFMNRMVFDPEILWKLDLDDFSETLLSLVSGKTGKYMQYKAYDLDGKRYVFAINFRNESGKRMSSQAALFRTGKGLIEMLENINKKVEGANAAEKERRDRVGSSGNRSIS